MGKMRSSKRKPKTWLEFQISPRSGAFHLLWGRRSSEWVRGGKGLLRFPPYRLCGNAGQISGWGQMLKGQTINRESWNKIKKKKKNFVEISDNDWEDTEIGLWVKWSTDTRRCASSFCMTQKTASLLSFHLSQICSRCKSAKGAMPLSTISKSEALVIKLKLEVIN